MSSQPVFVLVRPQMGENIGASARSMGNFGLEAMRIVEPRDGWPNPRASALASGAGKILDQAEICPSVHDAISDRTHVFATTARARDLTKPVFSPEAAMQEARDLIAQGGRVAVLFGPERSGLENDDIVQANAIITLPVNPAVPSLNLAQCVLLVGYEWRRQGVEITPKHDHLSDTSWATVADIAHLSQHYESTLEDAGFFFPPEKAEMMQQKLRNMWSRTPLTRSDVQMLHGVLRQLKRAKTAND